MGDTTLLISRIRLASCFLAGRVPSRTLRRVMLFCLECLSCDLYLFSVNIEAFTKAIFAFSLLFECVYVRAHPAIFKGAHVLGTSRSIAFPTIVAMKKKKKKKKKFLWVEPPLKKKKKK